MYVIFFFFSLYPNLLCSAAKPGFIYDADEHVSEKSYFDLARNILTRESGSSIMVSRLMLNLRDPKLSPATSMNELPGRSRRYDLQTVIAIDTSGYWGRESLDTIHSDV